MIERPEPAVSFSPVSVETGVAPTIEISSPPKCQEEVSVQWAIARVSTDFTSLAWASSGTPKIEGDCWRIECPRSHQLKPGLYRLTELKVHRGGVSSKERALILDPGLCLLHVRVPGHSVPTEEDLVSLHEKLVEEQQAEFMRGFGDGRKRYQVFVFVRDLLVTCRMRLLRYEILPSVGLPYDSEAGVIEAFLSESGIRGATIPPRMRNEAEARRPTAVIYFPVVYAEDTNRAKSIAEYEAQLLARLLAIQRGSGGTVFASVAIAEDGQAVDFRAKVRPYEGNVLGGVLSRESPPQIARRMQKLRSSDSLQLYCSLFWEAIREENSNLQWYRYWNLLETIARAKGLRGKPRRQWDGSVVQDRQAPTISTASQLVFELLRQVLPARNMSESSFAGDLSQGLISEQIPIWYRRRNCAVHGGECLCRNPNLSLTGAYLSCKRAADEMENVGFDLYLHSLQSVCGVVLAAELDAMN